MRRNARQGSGESLGETREQHPHTICRHQERPIHSGSRTVLIGDGAAQMQHGAWGAMLVGLAQASHTVVEEDEHDI